MRFTDASRPFLLLLLCCSPSIAQDLDSSFPQNLVNAAVERTNHNVTYDGGYRQIRYPGGDVPNNIGVCTDVIIRSYRAIGFDLQVAVHEDMLMSFSEYPQDWGLSHPDRNIDHRRVPNLQRFFARHESMKPITDDAEDYQPGDIVTWMLPGNLPHIGIVIDQLSNDTKRHLIVHNIGSGPKTEDILFRFPITGHFRFEPEDAQ